MLTFAVAGLFGGIALAVWVLLSTLEERSTMRASLRQLDDYHVETQREREMLDPFGKRIGQPVMDTLLKLGNRYWPTGYVVNARRKLTIAGKPTQQNTDRFLAIRVGTIAAMLPAGLALYFLLPVKGLLLYAAIGFAELLLGLGPDAILNREIEERQHAIRVALPDILDLLVISVEAGLGFEQALDRTVVAVPGPLSDEFSRMIGEVRAGSNRSEAMRAIDERTDVAELRSFTLAIIQADTFGVSIGRVLRSQADEMRIKRRQLAQEQAMKAPVKMLIPMVFCIFPALFVVVIGPAMINISRTLGK